VSFFGSVGGMRSGGAALLRHRGITATAGAAIVVLIAGCTYAASAAHGTGQENLANVSENKTVSQHTTKPAPPVGPLKLLSVSPASGTHDVNGGAAITAKFSSALSPTTPLPTLSPAIPGKWKVSGATATFTPASGFLPDTKVTVKIPGGPAGMTGAAASAGELASPAKVTYTTGTYSTLRLQQLLVQLGYLPLTFTPSDPATGTIAASDANGQVSAAYDPPAGSFTFQPGYPTNLTSQWAAGTDNILVDGAVRAFEYNQGLTMDGDAGPSVWSHLLAAVAKNQANPNGYTYALADQDSPNETLKVWHDGKQILDTPANTGIPASSTEDGTFPVYLRYQVTQMQGNNPDGTPYDDTVYWVSYFNGGDAVHYFPRPGYGYYQSLGCVELQWDPAKFIWPYMTYGTLVTVTGPVA
jgi:peptidoglycan hydrolase-like protein with peptidoglycan-binding domain